MKLSKIAKNVLKEDESRAAEQAHHLDLQAAPYGNWKDPQTDKVVAKSVNGGETLVKTEPGDTDTPEPEGFESDELPEPTPDQLEEPEDLLSPETPDVPEDEYVPPPSAVEPNDLANIGGGDVNRTLMILAKKYHDATGNPDRQAAIQAQMEKVKHAEEAEHQNMIGALARVQAKKDAELSARKEKLSKNPKYAQYLNNPNKDL